MDSVPAATYDPEPTAVAAARRFVRNTLASWELPGGDDILADAELLTSELVSNAVIHAHTRVQVTCRTNRSEVEVSVLDWQPGRPIRSSQHRETDASHATGSRPGPSKLRPKMPVVWEIHPVTKIVFEP